MGTTDGLKLAEKGGWGLPGVAGAEVGTLEGGGPVGCVFENENENDGAADGTPDGGTPEGTAVGAPEGRTLES